MFKLKRFALPAIVLLLPFLSAAQAVIDLNEVIRIGLENNYDLKISRNEQQISDNNLTLGNAGFLPSVGLNSGYSV
ncbi:MAG TPA: TolC family protein, partial [Porphyromonadaceae bacterium]|nr:TolC family protein [Porphyromonadaceae bacterium]